MAYNKYNKQRHSYNELLYHVVIKYDFEFAITDIYLFHFNTNS